MSRRAKDVEEYDWAVDAIRRFKEAGHDMQGADLQRLAVATNMLADLFLYPSGASESPGRS